MLTQWLVINEGKRKVYNDKKEACIVAKGKAMRTGHMASVYKYKDYLFSWVCCYTKKEGKLCMEKKY